MRNELTIKQWRSEQFDGLRLFNTSYSNHQFPSHFHDYYSFISIRHGVNEGFTEKRPYRFDAGSILAIGPGQVHAGNSYQKRPLSFDALHVEPDVIDSRLPKYLSNGYPTWFDTKPLRSARGCRIFDLLCQSIRLSDAPLLLDELLEEFLNVIIEDFRQTQSIVCDQDAHPEVLKAVEYLRENYKYEIRLEELAQAVCLSRFHLIRQFRKHVGLSPFQYLRNYRVDQARKRLNQHGSLAAIANSVGFYDESHLIRNFYHVMGISPSSYRKAVN